MRNRIVRGFVVAFVTVVSSAHSAHGQSQPPAARIFGTITINGTNAQNGAVVTAYSGNTLCGTASGNFLYNGTTYIVDITFPACARPGTVITFKVNGLDANQSSTIPNAPGSANRLDLVVSVPVVFVGDFGSATVIAAPTATAPAEAAPAAAAPAVTAPAAATSAVSAPAAASFVPASPPGAPYGVQATALGPDSIRLEWQSGGGEQGFEIDDVATGAAVKTLAAGTTSFTLVGLTPAAEYCVMIYATNAAGYPDPSDQVCATTPAF